MGQIETQKKKCSKCGEEKPVSEFHKKKKGKYGVHAACKVCSAKKKKEYRRLPSTKEKVKNYLTRNKDRIRLVSKELYNKKKVLKPKNQNVIKVKTQVDVKLKKEKARLYYHKDVLRSRGKNNINFKKKCESLDPAYIKKQLKKKGFTDDMLKQEPGLIQLQSIIIKTKRLCNQKRKGQSKI